VLLDKVDDNKELLLGLSARRKENYISFVPYLLRKRVCHHNVVLVSRLFANMTCYIRWPGRTGLILETSQVSFHLVEIGFQLDLMGKGNIGLGILVEASIGCTIHHNSTIRIRL